jgi:hypothetical protein
VVRRRPDNEIQPRCDELAGGGADAAAGISGAPCLVADVAIGVIHEVLAYGGAVVGGSLLVVLVSTIAAEGGGAITTAELPTEQADPRWAAILRLTLWKQVEP